jgi:hypothetical protein
MLARVTVFEVTAPVVREFKVGSAMLSHVAV